MISSYFFQLPYSLSLFYFMISCKGKGKEWTGKKYTKLVYFLAISGNSGVQKERASMKRSDDTIFGLLV